MSRRALWAPGQPADVFPDVASTVLEGDDGRVGGPAGRSRQVQTVAEAERRAVTRRARGVAAVSVQATDWLRGKLADPAKAKEPKRSTTRARPG